MPTGQETYSSNLLCVSVCVQGEQGENLPLNKNNNNNNNNNNNDSMGYYYYCYVVQGYIVYFNIVIYFYFVFFNVLNSHLFTCNKLFICFILFIFTDLASLCVLDKS